MLRLSIKHQSILIAAAEIRASILPNKVTGDTFACLLISVLVSVNDSS